MQLNIKNGEAWRLATELAALTGESLTEAVTKALAERPEQERRERAGTDLARLAGAGLSGPSGFFRYGKGRQHPVGLNFGDCFAYALAKSLDAPLLLKGDDAAHTDVKVA